jgi:2,4-dienoyl-CoA reductase-like NADH-dependent reductase (Old Yellow Enzyme family)
MTRVSTGGDGVPTQRMTRYYADFAEGGFGLVITEGVYPDDTHSQAYWNQPGITTAEQTKGWAHVAEAVRSAGAAIVMQLMHAGALVQENPNAGQGLAPSAVRPKGEKMPAYGGRGPFPTPKAMTATDFEAVREAFAASATRAAEAGFDGVEIHGANGYLLDQFITTYTNQRSDRYGGSPGARIRFPVEVVEAVRGAVPDSFVVGYRLSQTKVNDFEYRWPGGTDEGAVYFSALSAAGVDYLHVASEGRDWIQTAELEPGITITRLARDVGDVPVIANGGMHDTAQASRVLSEGHADLIALGRGALANSDWPRRLAEGRPFAAFDPDMLDPVATIENADAWRAARAGSV